MKRWTKIFGGIFLIVCIIVMGLFCLFQNEIKALQYHSKYSQEEQAVLVQENEDRMNALMQQVQIPVEAVIDDTTEQLEDKNNVSATMKPTNVNVDKNTSNTTQEKLKKQQNYDSELAGMIGEIYALRTSFVGQLDQLLVEAKNEYIAVPEAEREKQKKTILNKYIKKAGGLEVNCDKQMNEILGRMKTHLKKTGGDVSLVGEIQKVYENEKALKKAYYLSYTE